MEELYNARNTVRDILRRRGYLLAPEDETETYMDMCNTFATSTRPSGLATRPSGLTMVAMHETQRTLIAVIFHILFEKPKEKVGIACMRQYNKILKNAAVSRAILVTQHGLTHSSLKKLEKKREHLYIEHFTLKSLAVNILKHHLVGLTL